LQYCISAYSRQKRRLPRRNRGDHHTGGITRFGKAGMPRKPRLHAPGGLYHVTLPGNHRQDLFRRDADRDRLDTIV